MKKVAIYITALSITLFIGCNKEEKKTEAPKQEAPKKEMVKEDPHAGHNHGAHEAHGEAVVEKKAAPVEFPFPKADKKVLPDPLTGMMLSKYITIQKALVKDDFKAAQKATKTFASSLANVPAKLSKSISKKALLASAKKAANEKDLESLRAAFKPLSENVITVLVENKYSGEMAAYITYCGMYKDHKKTYWVQDSKGAKNPYFGSKMLKCGTVAKVLE